MASIYSQIRKDVRRNAKHLPFTGKKPSVLLYGGVGMIALLKDLLDLVGIGSLPGIGTIVTACFSFLMWMLLTLFDRSGGKHNKKMIQGAVILFFGLVEAVGFGLNFLPIQTLTVVILYHLARKNWKKERAGAEKKNQAENAQLMRARMQAARNESEAERARAEEKERARAEQAQAVQNQREAANDAEYKQRNRV